jgi:hypothetical protein
MLAQDEEASALPDRVFAYIDSHGRRAADP